MDSSDLIKQVKPLNESQQYQQVVELLSDTVLEREAKADLYAEKAQALWSLKQFDKSKDAFDRALELDPKNAKALNYKGNYFRHQNQFDKAIATFQTSIKIDPDYESPYNGLGNIYNDLEQYDEAIKYYKKALEKRPKDVIILSNLGTTYLRKEDFKNAINFYNKGLRINPKDAISHYNLGLTYYAQDNFAEAIEKLKESLEIDPELVICNFNLGLAYFHNKELGESERYFQQYIDQVKEPSDYYVEKAQEKIEEIRKLLNNQYEEIRKSINEIKSILQFDEEDITHYTGLSVTKALILEASPFRLSEGAFLNDTSEGRELFKIVNFQVTEKRGDDTVAERFSQKPFIGSFVNMEKQDDLTLWRMYGKENNEEAKGCAITFDLKKLLKNIKNKLLESPFMATNLPEREVIAQNVNKEDLVKNEEDFNFYRVVYCKYSEPDKKWQYILPGTEDDEARFTSLMENLSGKFEKLKVKGESEKKHFEDLLNEIAFLFKSSQYQYENEIRLVVKGIGFDKKVDKSSVPPRVYIELVSITSIIRKITLGPKVLRAKEWAAAFFYSLKNDNNPVDLGIHISHLPFK